MTCQVTQLKVSEGSFVIDEAHPKRPVLFAYRLNPVDHWFEQGWRPIPHEWFGIPVFDIAETVFDAVPAKSHWRESVFFLPLPFSSSDEAEFALARKEDDNGTTWIISSRQLRYLEKESIGA